eukprot:224778-Pleurochrysis_carterae.AAC.1
MNKLKWDWRLLGSGGIAQAERDRKSEQQMNKGKGKQRRWEKEGSNKGNLLIGQGRLRGPEEKMHETDETFEMRRGIGSEKQNTSGKHSN